MTYDVDHLFICLFAICVSSLVVSVPIFCSFKIFLSLRCTALQFDIWIHYKVITTTSLSAIHHHMFDPFPHFAYSPTLFPSGNHLSVLCIYEFVLVWFCHLFCFTDFTYDWDHTVFVFPCLTYFISIIPSGFIHVVPNGRISSFFMAQ